MNQYALIVYAVPRYYWEILKSKKTIKCIYAEKDNTRVVLLAIKCFVGRPYWNKSKSDLWSGMIKDDFIKPG